MPNLLALQTSYQERNLLRLITKLPRDEKSASFEAIEVIHPWSERNRLLSVEVISSNIYNVWSAEMLNEENKFKVVKRELNEGILVK